LEEDAHIPLESLLIDMELKRKCFGGGGPHSIRNALEEDTLIPLET
jgi:hypothetical protein